MPCRKCNGPLENRKCRACRKASDRAYRERNANNELRRAITAIRTARAASKRYHTTGSFTVDEWRGILERQNGCCNLCGESACLTVDHIVATERGGSNDISNIQGLCFTCNRIKGTKPWEKVLAKYRAKQSKI